MVGELEHTVTMHKQFGFDLARADGDYGDGNHRGIRQRAMSCPGQDAAARYPRWHWLTRERLGRIYDGAANGAA